MKLEMRTVQEAKDESKQAVKYFCPMHPDQIFDKPGICMKCGMDLRQQKAAFEK
jgi:hypothetical protein